MLRFVKGHLDVLDVYSKFRRSLGQSEAEARGTSCGRSFFCRRPSTCPLKYLETVGMGERGHGVLCLHTGPKGLRELHLLWPYLDDLDDGRWKNAEVKAQIEHLIQVRIFE